MEEGETDVEWGGFGGVELEEALVAASPCGSCRSEFVRGGGSGWWLDAGVEFVDTPDYDHVLVGTPRYDEVVVEGETRIVNSMLGIKERYTYQSTTFV